jgi:ribosome maturation factor RimP
MAQGRRTSAGARPAAHETAGGPSVQRARLRAVVEPIVVRAGFDLEDLTVARAGRRSVVRVTVDGEGGVTHDALADLSRDLSAALDDAEATGGELSPTGYELEVSSPGVDRPLTEARHWRRNIGRLVKVNVGGRPLTARIMGTDADTVILDAGGQRHRVNLAELGPGRVQVEFGRLDELSESDDAEETVTGESGEAGETDRDEEGEWA